MYNYYVYVEYIIFAVQRKKQTIGGIIMYEGTITRRIRSGRKNIYRNLLTKEDFESKLFKMKQVKGTSQYPSLCAELNDMFKAIGIRCEKSEDIPYYEKLIYDNEGRFSSKSKIEKRIIKTMFECFKEHPTPEDYMLRIVNRLSNPQDGWGNDTLRLRILKQFIKYGDYLTYKRKRLDESGKEEKVAVYGGEKAIKKYAEDKTGKKPKNIEDVLTNIDDGIFELLSVANDDQLKGKYKLIKISDDLAKGKFRANGSTRKDLYMFAFVFYMTFSCYDENDEADTEIIKDYNSDIEKNLFEDYYTNNLMRFLTDAYEGNLSAYELDPSGRGINYKNFAEMVYIYYISKDLSPIEKIKYSSEMIARLEEKAKEKVGSAYPDTDRTQYYRDLFTEDILDMSETEFESFIAENYDCNTKLEKTKVNEIQLHSEDNTAFRLYKQLIYEIDNDTIEEIIPILPDEEETGKEKKGEKDDKETHFSHKNCNYGLWFTDVSIIEKKGSEELKKFLDRAALEYAKKNGTEIKEDDPDKFIKLLSAINDLMGITFCADSDDSDEQEDEEESGTSNEQENEEESDSSKKIKVWHYKAISRQTIKK